MTFEDLNGALTGLVACLVLCFLLGALFTSAALVSTPGDVDDDDADDDDDDDDDEGVEAADTVEGLSAVDSDDTFNDESSEAMPSSWSLKKVLTYSAINVEWVKQWLA